MMKILFLLSLTVFTLGAISQNQKQNNINSQFWYCTAYEIANGCLLGDTLTNELTVYFEDGFKDTVEVFFDNKLRMKDFLMTNFSTSYTGKSLLINYRNITLNDDLYIEIKTSDNSSADIKIARGYRIMRISKSKLNIWNVIYTNSKCLIYE